MNTTAKIAIPTQITNFSDIRNELDPDKVLFCLDNKGILRYEEFRDIIGHEGYYQVSNFSRVKSLKRKVKHRFGKNGFKTIRQTILSQTIHKSGYLMVNLCKNCKSCNITVNLLIGKTFLNQKPKGTSRLVCDHIDNIRTNNFVWNLQLLTNRKNCSKDRKGYASEYVGVSLHKQTGKWRARISVNGETKHLGLFYDEYEAHLAYQKELKKII